ncbi:MAG: hypothetical protein LUD14_02265 [Clostridiales bacterium]|nr:hypothetical protein [Clostridiales bacterium]
MDFAKAHYGIALVLDEQEIGILAENYADKNGEEPDEVLENIMFGDPLNPSRQKDEPSIEIKEILNDNSYGGIEFYNWEKNEGSEEKEGCWAMFADRQLPGQNIFAQPPYRDMGCLITEFKNKLCRYLPDDFDYQSHIGFLVYCAIS